MTTNEVIVVIAKAIALRDNAQSMTRAEATKAVIEVASYGLFSARQIEKICQKKVSHSTISRAVLKSRKSGGKLNPEDLENIRTIIFAKSMNQIDWNLVADVIARGTSPEMLQKLTGLQPTMIRRKVSNAQLV